MLRLQAGRLAELGDQLKGLRDRLTTARKNPETCPSVAGMFEDDWRWLDAIEPEQGAPDKTSAKPQ
jgi:hypothetical protein